MTNKTILSIFAISLLVFGGIFNQVMAVEEDVLENEQGLVNPFPQQEINAPLAEQEFTDEIPAELSEEELNALLENEELMQEMLNNADNVVLIATVNLYDAEIIKQEDNVFDLSFLITNREKAQPNIRYAIQLT